jgi:hypothetical protein
MCAKKGMADRTEESESQRSRGIHSISSAIEVGGTQSDNAIDKCIRKHRSLEDSGLSRDRCCGTRTQSIKQLGRHVGVDSLL